MSRLQHSKPGIGHNAAPSLDSEQADREKAVDYDDGLLAVAGPIMVLCYAGALGIAALTFFGSGEALFGVVISVGFGGMYFTLPLLMRRVRSARDQRWQSDAAHRADALVELWTGPISRWEGIAQIVSVPLAVLFGFASFAVIWTLTA
jgi:hypothetical protein